MEAAGGVEAAGGADAAGGASAGAVAGWLVCGLFWPYIVRAKPGASSKLLATINFAGIIWLIATSYYT